MKKLVISLGGSVLVPDEVNTAFLEKFKKFILKMSRNNKIVVVTGGGHTARVYIQALSKNGTKTQSFMGIAFTRLHAKFLYNFFKLPFYKIPKTLKEVHNLLKRNNLVFCGALRYEPNQTSDGTAAEIARYMKADMFINITNVKGLYNKDPCLKNAKLIKRIRFDDFYKKAKKIKFKAGQHFVLDFSAAKIIKEERIKTYIVSSNLKNIENLLKGKSFIGTLVY